TTDTVMGSSTTLIRPDEGSLADYGRTLELFQSVGAKTMYTGHGGPISDPAARLQALIDHRKRREAELLEALANGPKTVPGLRAAIYVGLPEVREPLAEAQVLSRLKKLIDEGAVRAEGDEGAPSTYSLS
ncbi:MAG: MBL fold metallo-hydrolase, partial [Chloroflexi bacterium]|nr:MBL fold metallo-hydrolase [Chloroflexota bacterium]